ncbi:glycoside hydrolase family 127 protein [Anditalea andensis]|uniref:Acetyl-CoA carboxylase n=1 Tax=Anditalea andensis TaxID=1048983 RepID=A0A074L1R1_9BACT|nr:glycoside hydrolase family 127 protein [Anditalea andensis]KEO74435.1 acetyl-CoA carboxylase [Anditalea andensis]
MKKIQGLIVIMSIVSCSSIAYGQGHSKAKLFNLEDVRLLESDFLKAQQTDIHYMLEMDMDRLLAPYMLEAGLPWNAERYTNWENTGLDGHIAGHYLSALSMMYASTGRMDLKERLDYMVSNLSIAQEAHGDGYLAGIPNGKKIWEEIKIGKINAETFSLNNHWVPLYNIHKIFAGLADAHLDGGSVEAKVVLDKLGKWFLDIFSDLSEEQVQQILVSEHGGFNEIFAIMYEIFEDDGYLEAAKKMSHHEILNPLLDKEDKLTGYHANTQIPKVIGYQKIGLIEDKEEWKSASAFFWDRVVNHRSVSIGGNSVREHFHPKQDFSEMLSSNQGPETCNTYNMLKLTELLFQDDPAARYADYYERALYNHILSSQHPDGGFVYFTPMRPKHYRVYSKPHEGFWCCVGSGLENHSKYGKFIYAYEGENLYVNLYVPSVLSWKDKGIEITQTTKFPFDDKITLTINTHKEQQLSLKIRKPIWVTSSDNISLKVNDEIIGLNIQEDYITMDRKWKDGDKITVNLPMEIHKEYLPDDSKWVSILYGPIVLAAADRNEEVLDGIWADDSRMGHIAHGEMKPLNTSDMYLADRTQKINQEREILTFDFTDQITSIKNENILLEPFYKIHEARYQIYFPVIDHEEEITSRRVMLSEKDEVFMKLASRTVDEIALGEQQPESDHFYRSGRTRSGNIDGFFWRSPIDWMSYQLRNMDKKAQELQLTFIPQDASTKVDIFINDTLLVEEEISKRSDKAPFTNNYILSEDMMNSEILEIRFKTKEGHQAPNIHHIRLLNGSKK